jgi:tripartite ATP-independent transporter DctM subunit
MSPEIVGLIGIVVLLALMVARMWIGAAMALVGLLGVIYIRGFDLALQMAQIVPYKNVAFYALSVVPLFILMGVVIAEAGIGTDLYHAAHEWLGHFRGGLAIATTLACAVLASVTAVGSAAVVVMGKVALPEMRKYNYDLRLATGCISCSTPLAFLIPPSLAFIMYGILTEQSVGKLFMAGIFPGILLASLYILTIIIITAIRPLAGPPGPKTTFKEKIVSLKGSWHVVCLFLLVLGGIYGGIFTPTEGGAVGAFGAIVIAIIGRRFTPQSFLHCVSESVVMTGMVLLTIVGVFIFMHFLAVSKVAFVMGDFIVGLGVPRMVIFAAIVIAYLILGMFLDIMAAVMLTIPIFYPTILALGFDPIWFGVIVVILIQMGLVTPPVGMEVFILSGITGVPVGTIFRGIWPFCVAIIICIIILTIFPQIALFIPSTMQ